MKNSTMTQEEKNLLLKDLCARLPYGVKYMDILNPDEHPSTLQSIDNCGLVMANDGFSHEIENVKPYLFPLSSMTEEQKNAAPFESSLLNAFINGYISLFEDEELTIDDLNRLYDWFDKNHFDYRGLIPMGLAIDATGLNIY